VLARVRSEGVLKLQRLRVTDCGAGLPAIGEVVGGWHRGKPVRWRILPGLGYAATGQTAVVVGEVCDETDSARAVRVEVYDESASRLRV